MSRDLALFAVGLCLLAVLSLPLAIRYNDQLKLFDSSQI
jgi:hypothetical protein